jgi:hypothetical protein
MSDTIRIAHELTRLIDDEVARFRASHDRLLATAKKVIERNPVPRGARRVEFDDLEDAIAAAEEIAP